MKHTKKILIVGAGYVGLAYTSFFAQKYDVTVLDTDDQKIQNIKNRQPVSDELLVNTYLEKYHQNISPTTNVGCFKKFDLALMCLPTDYDEDTNYFDTQILSNMVEYISNNGFGGLIVIKSTVPVGYTNETSKKFQKKIIFSPEFLREGKTLSDILNPSRVVAGGNYGLCKEYFDYINSCVEKASENLQMDTNESEAVKLFSNTYLAMRVSYFNELDSFCVEKELDTKSIINAVCMDDRIGHHYNNPSFGYGGYCLPKDTKQLLANYEQVPQNLIGSIVQANKTRKNFIVNLVLSKNKKNIGIFRLVMKKDSDNIRESSILDIIKQLKKHELNVIIFEPSINEALFLDCEVIKDFESFKNKSDIILANRYSEILDECREKILTRDVFLKG